MCSPHMFSAQVRNTEHDFIMFVIWHNLFIGNHGNSIFIIVVTVKFHWFHIFHELKTKTAYNIWVMLFVSSSQLIEEKKNTLNKTIQFKNSLHVYVFFGLLKMPLCIWCAQHYGATQLSNTILDWYFSRFYFTFFSNHQGISVSKRI